MDTPRETFDTSVSKRETNPIPSDAAHRLSTRIYGTFPASDSDDPECRNALESTVRVMRETRSKGPHKVPVSKPNGRRVAPRSGSGRRSRAWTCPPVPATPSCAGTRAPRPTPRASGRELVVHDRELFWIWRRKKNEKKRRFGEEKPFTSLNLKIWFDSEERLWVVACSRRSRATSCSRRSTSAQRHAALAPDESSSNLAGHAACRLFLSFHSEVSSPAVFGNGRRYACQREEPIFGRGVFEAIRGGCKHSRSTHSDHRNVDGKAGTPRNFSKFQSQVASSVGIPLEFRHRVGNFTPPCLA